MEETHKSTASELDGMPDVDRKETEEILAEIEKDEKPNDQKSPEEQKPEEEKKEETPEKKPEEKKPEERKPAEGKRTPGLMPRYVHEIAVKEKDQTISDLQKTIDDLKAGKGPESKEDPKTPEQQNDLKGKVATMAEKLAEKHKGVSKELIQDLAESLVDLGLKPAEIPKEITDKLKKVDEWSAQQEVQAEESAFNAAFDKEVVPLIEAEYGKLPEDTISEIRKLAMEKAYTDEFGKTPLSVIYKGLDEFRSFKRTPARSAEPSRGGHERAAADAPEGDDATFENATEEDIEKMDPATFDRYTAWAEAREKANR